MLDLYSDEVAEGIFQFMTDNKEQYDKFCQCLINEDLSMAEYIDKYCREEFEKYFFNTFLWSK